MDEIPRGQCCPGQHGFDVRFRINGWKAASVPGHRHTVGAHQELLRVPGDVVEAHQRPGDELGISHESSGVLTAGRQDLLQKDEDGVRLRAIHLVLRRRQVGLEPAA